MRTGGAEATDDLQVAWEILRTIVWLCIWLGVSQRSVIKMSEFTEASGDGPGLTPSPPSRLRQFQAIMYKNFLLQLRSRFVFCGLRIGGTATVAFEVLLPVLFIGAMSIVTQLPRVPYPPLVFREWALSDTGWSGHVKGARCLVLVSPCHATKQLGVACAMRAALRKSLQDLVFNERIERAQSICYSLCAHILRFS
jgi:hypothetical protein